MAKKFLTKFFPPSKTSQLRAEITQFRQMDFEQLYEAWDRFKEMLRKCPQHGIEDWFQVQLFYNRLNGPTRSHIDATSGGTILSKTPTEALILFEDMSMNSCQWHSERSTVRKEVGVFEVDQITSLMAQMSALTNQIKGLTDNKVTTSQETVNLSQASSSNGMIDEQCQYVNQNYNFRPNNNLPTYYHPSLRNHEKISYAKNRIVLQPPQEPPRQMGEKPSPSLEELLKTYIVDSKARLDQHDTRLNNIETHCTNMGATMKTLETQVGQLANTMKNQMSRCFPSVTEKIPKECNVITLRSGKELDAPTVKKKKVDEIPMNGEKEEDKQKEEILKKESLVANPSSITFPDNPPKITTPLPFPQRFRKKAIDEKFAKFLNIFKKIHINIPFVDALEQMPNYTKFMKEVMSKKHKLEDYETVKLMEECSAIIKSQLPEKLKDLGSFTIPCVIGELHIEKALCDLGASINLMPLSIFQKLNLGEVTPTTISLQLADRSLTYPRGIIEDVVLKIDGSFFRLILLCLTWRKTNKFL
ncbi:uncharacterized protein LOC133815042 [Humulus lupulus]|uniref:uncharacterized protein LOC133815042 n=1 Tax=Humulus lupulus TaxID=3486 RepID=UPI002B41161B|nr:uncharacterized protein LOC133815042 [Humulus lupulus]